MFNIPNLLAPVAPDAHKYSRGVVGILAGSAKYPGAAVLCVGGARRGGAGYVKYVAQNKFATAAVIAQYPDVVPVSKLKDEKADAWVVGPGAPRITFIPEDTPLVLDGAAIRHASRKRTGIAIITPHNGELKHLGYELAQREETARRIADELNVIVVLKGRHTIVAAPHQALLVDEIGGPELACAGSGDILAGLLGSMLASWRPATLGDAASVVYKTVIYHSSAAKIAREAHNPVVATDILSALSKVNVQ
jgi:hydroxyethylthiazole kinase-like uncharacterized protein yjeF